MRSQIELHRDLARAVKLVSVGDYYAEPVRQNATRGDGRICLVEPSEGMEGSEGVRIERVACLVAPDGALARESR